MFRIIDSEGNRGGERNPDGVDEVSSFGQDCAHFRILSGIKLSGLQQMANNTARAMFIVDHVGLNGAFAVNSPPTPNKKAFVQEFGDSSAANRPLCHPWCTAHRTRRMCGIFPTAQLSLTAPRI